MIISWNVHEYFEPCQRLPKINIHISNKKNVINSFKVISYSGKKNDGLKINMSRDDETHWNWKHVLNFIPFDRAKSIYNNQEKRSIAELCGLVLYIRFGMKSHSIANYMHKNCQTLRWAWEFFVISAKKIQIWMEN